MSHHLAASFKSSPALISSSVFTHKAAAIVCRALSSSHSQAGGGTSHAGGTSAAGAGGVSHSGVTGGVSPSGAAGGTSAAGAGGVSQAGGGTSHTGGGVHSPSSPTASFHDSIDQASFPQVGKSSNIVSDCIHLASFVASLSFITIILSLSKSKSLIPYF